MHFLNPWLLLGTLGVAVPVVVHLLNRYRYRQIDWGAMELLRRALVVRSRRLRLEDLLLLALRCLAVLLLALALARPTWAPAAPGLGGDVGVVLAVDASFSMEHRPGVRSRLERARERLAEVARTLPPGTPVSLAVLGDRPRVLSRAAAHDPAGFEQLLAAVEPLPEGLDLQAGLDEVRRLLDETKAAGRECYLVTDAQALTWGRPSQRARELLAQIGTASRAFLLTVGTRERENVAVVDFDRQAGLLTRGGRARYLATIRNHGEAVREQVAVTLTVNDTPVDRQVVSALGPGEGRTVPLFARFDAEGVARLEVRLAGDELPRDDVRHAVAHVTEGVRILLVRGPGLEEAADTEVDYVRTALAPRPGGPVEVETAAWVQLPEIPLADYHAVVLADVPDLPPAEVDRLFRFVQGGGGLILVPGEATRPEVFNALFRRDGRALSPASLALDDNPVSSKEEGWAVEPLAHPLVRVLQGVSEPARRTARVQRYFRMELAPGARPALSVEGKEPLVAEMSVGHGRVVLFATAADPAWTNMVVEPGLYPLLLHEAVVLLMRKDYETPGRVSGPLLLPLQLPEGGTVPDKVAVRTPGGKSLTLPASLRDGRAWAEVPRAEQPGFYSVSVATDLPEVTAAVNVDPAESEVRALTEDELREVLAPAGISVVAEGEDVASAVEARRVGRELWKGFLLAGLLVLLMESTLARRFTRRAGA